MRHQYCWSLQKGVRLMNNRSGRQGDRGRGRFQFEYRGGGRGPPLQQQQQHRPFNMPFNSSSAPPPPPPPRFMGRGDRRGGFQGSHDMHRTPMQQMGRGRNSFHHLPPQMAGAGPPSIPPPPFRPPPGPPLHFQQQHNQGRPPPPPHPPAQFDPRMGPSRQAMNVAPGRFNQPQFAAAHNGHRPNGIHAATVPHVPPPINGHYAVHPPPLLASVPPLPTHVPPRPQYTQAHIDAAWKLYTDQTTGRAYYTNALISKSQFEKPECLVLSEQQQMKQAATSVASATAWKEYKDVTTGKTYYSNGTITTWEKPQELMQCVATSDSSDKKDVQQPDAASSTKKRARKQSPTPSDIDFGSKEEAISTFKGLLLVKDVGPALKWQEVAKLCQTDRRWEACLAALSMGECKQALAEYQTKRANELRDMERKERARAKTVFMELLTSVVPTLPSFSAHSSRFGDFRDALIKDERFHAVDEERIRENLFADFCEEFQKREERHRINKKRLAQEHFLAFLAEKAESDMLQYSTTWTSFLSSLQETELQDKRFMVSTEFSDQDRQLFFADFVLELQRQEDDKRRRIREATRRAEKEQREAFISALTDLAVKGKIVPATKWRILEEQLSLHPSYAPLKSQHRDGPREVFDVFVTEWNAKYRKERTYLSQIIYPSSIGDEIVKEDTIFDDYLTALLERATEQSPAAYRETKRIINDESPVSSALLYFNELSMRAKGLTGPPILRHGSAIRGNDSDSSEDEGEIEEFGLPDIMIT
ncbi:hypothetical protein MPSEU_000951300 [Mayamaea pseudoterrestris]|nr:hypothetical protein MPSEU_000951300 [Mayamaea pseudoterrestris]